MRNPLAQKSTPPGFGNGSSASIRASIDAVALAVDSGNDNSSNDDDYSFFGKLPNPDPKDLSPRYVGGDFIALSHLLSCDTRV